MENALLSVAVDDQNDGEPFDKVYKIRSLPAGNWFLGSRLLF